MRKFQSIMCASAMILTLTACDGNSVASTSSDSTMKQVAQEQSSEGKTEKTEKPEITKEGILTRKAIYYILEGESVLGYEELRDSEGKLMKITLDEVFTDMIPHFVPSASLGVTEYTYDSNGNLVKETCNNAYESTIKEYDENGFLIASKHKNAEQSQCDEDRTYMYEKDASGNPVKGYYINNLIDNSGAYVYDDAGNILSGTFDARHLICDLECRDGRKVKETEYVHWAGKTENAVGHIYEYDSNGKKIHETNYGEDGNVTTEIRYEYDSEGRLVKQMYAVSGDAGDDVGWEYVYDAEGTCVNRIIWQDGKIDESMHKPDDTYVYEYDEYGNVIKGALTFENGYVSGFNTVYEYLYKD